MYCLFRSLGYDLINLRTIPLSYWPIYQGSKRRQVNLQWERSFKVVLPWEQTGKPKFLWLFWLWLLLLLLKLLTMRTTSHYPKYPKMVGGWDSFPQNMEKVFWRKNRCPLPKIVMQICNIKSTYHENNHSLPFYHEK